MGKIAEEESAYLHVLRVAMISFLKGSAPIMAVEFARRAIPGHVRPSLRKSRHSVAVAALTRRLKRLRPAALVVLFLPLGRPPFSTARTVCRLSISDLISAFNCEKSTRVSSRAEV